MKKVNQRMNPMRSRAILAMVSVVLIVYAPMAESAPAATPVLGRVTAKGDLKINGTTTLSGGTIFSGDELGTGANAVAELILNGGSKVMLPESSTVVMNNDSAQVIVNLKQGALAELSKNASPAFIDAIGARIKPAASVAVVLEVAVHGNSLKVVARRGSATVETADKTIEVAEGKELDATTAPASPQGPAPTGMSSLATWELIAAVAAGATGLILGAVALSRSVNPANCTIVSPSTITCP